MPPLPPQPLLLHLLINPHNGLVLDQLPFIPGYDQIQAGQPLTEQQFRLFRTRLMKTIRIHRERHTARVHLSKLYHRTKVEKWVHHFAPFSVDLGEALLPFVKIACYCFSWPYAELWRQSDTPGARTLQLVRSFSFAYDRWVIVEPLLASLNAHMKSRAITLPSREIPADAFTSHKSSWDVECINSCPDATRAKLMKDAFMTSAFILPLKGGVPRSVTHALVFYGKYPSNYTFSGPKRFVEFASQYIKDCHGRVEVIGEDEGDKIEEIKEEAEEKRIVGAIMHPDMGSVRFRTRLRRSHSYVHNLRSVGRGL